MSNKWRVIGGLLIAVILIFGAVAAGVEYHVATTGDDTPGNGSSGNPWKTITYALTQVSAGDTIIVAPGTYLEWTGAVSAGCAVQVPWYAEGAGGLTIRSSGGAANTIIDCGWAGSGVNIVSNNITFDGFTVKNAYEAIGQVSAKNHTLSNLIISDFVNYGIWIGNAHYCTFSNITIHGNDVSKSEDRTVKGIDIQEYGSGGNSNNTFEDITIYDIETTGTYGSTYGIYWEGNYQATHPTTNNTFTNVTIHDMTGPWWEAGIYMVGKDTPGDNLPGIEYTTFSGGNIYNCAWAIFVQDGCSDVSISEFYLTNIDYNVIRFEGGGTGLMSNIAITENACLSTTIYTAITVADTGSGSITISNNDVRNNGSGIGIYGTTDATFVTAHYNNIEGNTGYGVKNFGSGTLDAEYNWWGSPTGPCRQLPNGKWVGKGDKVSGNVDYIPRLPHPVEFFTIDHAKPLAITDELKVVAYPNPIRDVNTATFQVMGTLAAEVEEIRVQIYDLSGHLVWEDAALGSELDWHTDSLSGDYLANGIYLYRVQVRIGGSWINQDIGKIAVLR